MTRIKAEHEITTNEYLQLKAGNFAGIPITTLAAFLETRRYAALMGATTEFEKYEDVAYNARNNKAYKTGVHDGISMDRTIKCRKYSYRYRS